ncbi:glycosyltransferase [Nocardioides zeae]|uniref:Glycosyltransferase family 1 protein n=1 Tax=Nocardioides zeae TaxID=1457234 RepID=A0A6P0HEY3_9ACTN|nr:glycosyltransferase [Nocardioides zeae]NEN77292.1 glycosyltransferase family 1 protein [Nocardioides zeae]
MSRDLLVWGAGVRWDDVPGTDHQLVRRLAEHLDVWWVDPPVSVVRRPSGPGGRARIAPVAPGVLRVPVASAPFPSRPGGRVLARAASAASVRRLLERDGRVPRAVVSARPEPHLRAVPTSCRVYYATDDFAAGAALWGLSAAALRHAEERSLAAADLALAITPAIRDRWPTDVPTALLPNGCDAQAFAAVPPPDPAAEPVAVVVGQLSARLDLGLLEAVAVRGRRLLLVGPAAPSLDLRRFVDLVGRPSVTWTGRRRPAELPDLLAGTTVGLTPYADTAFNRASHPLKTLEYLAAGRPVVATPLPAVADLGCRYVATAATPTTFADAVDQALAAPSDPAASRACQAFARQHDWSVRADTLLARIGAVAGTGSLTPAGR